MTKTYKVRYRKTLPQRIQYAGSTIQQNFGEDLDKGYLLWNIEDRNDFDSEFVRLENDYGFYTINAIDCELPDIELPPKCRIRVIWPVAERDISRSLVNELTTMVQDKYKPMSVRIDFKPIKDTRGRDLDVNEPVDVREFSVQQDLLKRWLNQHELEDELVSEILDIDKMVYDKVHHLEFEDFSQSEWRINSITIKDFMSYKGPETIDFHKLKGVVGLFGDNRSGKSVIIDATLYALFNKTTRNVKNVDLINKVTGAKSCSVVLNITIRGVDYEIKRTSKKQFKKRSGEYQSTRTDLELRRFYDDGTEEDLTETQRNETEKIIRNAIGSFDDFLTTTLTIQASQHEFIFLNPSVRAENMARFLGLDIFNRKFDYAREILREVDAARKIADPDEKTALLGSLRDTIATLTETLDQKQKALEETTEVRQKLSQEIDSLQSSLNTKITVDQTKEEVQDRIDSVTSEVEEIKTKISDLEEAMRSTEAIIDEMKKSLVKVTEETSERASQLPGLLEEQAQVDSSIATEKGVLRSLRDQLQGQTNCPVGENDVTAGCVFLQQAHDLRSNIESRLARIEEYAQKNVKLENKIDRARSAALKLEKNSEIWGEIQTIQKKVDSAKQKVSSLKDTLEVKNMTLTMLRDKFQIIAKNEEIVKSNLKIKARIDELNGEKRSVETLRDRLYSEITSAERDRAVASAKVDELEKIAQEIATNDRKYQLYNWYTKAMHRNGIPITVLKNYIPVINYELSRVLSPIVGYGVYFKIDADSDNIDIVMRYDDAQDDTRPITMASGMEKFIANMAIRHVLLKVSALNKPTIRIIDEGFDVLDNDNVYLVQKFFEQVKGEFDNIVIITHIDALKDCADHMINVSQQGGVSKLRAN